MPHTRPEASTLAVLVDVGQQRGEFVASYQREDCGCSVEAYSHGGAIGGYERKLYSVLSRLH